MCKMNRRRCSTRGGPRRKQCANLAHAGFFPPSKMAEDQLQIGLWLVFFGSIAMFAFVMIENSCYFNFYSMIL